MQPHHDRALRIVERWGPDVQRQAVFVDRQRIDRSPDGGQFRSLRGGDRLGRTAGINDRLADTGPRLGLAWRHEAVCAGGRGAVGDALKDMHAV